MADDLPSDFDVVVLGTGLPESILAAALSRVGQKVLHIDRNEYYSGQWASFNLENITKWTKEAMGELGLEHPTIEEDVLLQPGETLSRLDLSVKGKTYFNIASEYHVSNEEEVLDKTDIAKECRSDDKMDKLNPDQVEENKDDNDSESNKDTLEASEEAQSEETKSNTETEAILEDKETKPMSEHKTDETFKKPSSSEDSVVKAEVTESKKPETWTASKLKKDWRRFNLDLAPRLLYCAGSMVELLISSDIAKYCEFRTVTRVLTFLNDKLEKVPCSRADVFSSKDVSMLEKRMLMKLLTFCADYTNHEHQYQDFADKPFKEFLKSQKLTNNICHYVQHSIAMATDTMTTMEGLARTKKFLHSLGRYGNTAFLWPLYGSGELPQSFCRMCAVFGGVYCLRTAVSAVICGADNKCKGVVLTNGQRINCRYVIMESSYADAEDMTYRAKRHVNRGIFITDRSVLPTEDQQLSLMFLPDPDNGVRPTAVLELPPSSMTCPQGLHAVHMTRPGTGDVHPREDLKIVKEKLFDPADDDKPNILWSMYFSQTYYEDLKRGESTPDNIIVLPGPGPEIDLNDVVTQTRQIFVDIMPGEEFLPRPPNPEDIIYVDENEATVGENKQSEFAGEESETNKTGDQSEGVKDTEEVTAIQSDESTPIKTDSTVDQSDESTPIKTDSTVDQSDESSTITADSAVDQSNDGENKQDISSEVSEIEGSK
ncbi:rab proteins geranylgeranyltransferase component A 2-like isoform X1 [Mizuhopecten yessoensis]|uniref:rab proteins geranylgeranyltransferase component A 2-like isoform X1 n=2 Tax=Mizuhopecten yessoensis TaxID=6573 RepID=UPI000B45EDCF|nr:rab proteins geranylgeranyltransferase component A 2-like isoform X1 [Mizuhopecten yessoensis]